MLQVQWYCDYHPDTNWSNICEYAVRMLYSLVASSPWSSPRSRLAGGDTTIRHSLHYPSLHEMLRRYAATLLHPCTARQGKVLLELGAVAVFNSRDPIDFEQGIRKERRKAFNLCRFASHARLVTT